MNFKPCGYQVKKPLTFLVAAFMSAAVFATDCKLSDIKLDSIEAKPGDYTIRVLGRIVNQCATPVGVQIKLIFYGAGDKLLSVEDIWPASTNNIRARSDFPFGVRFETQPGLLRVEGRVIAVRRW